jgi:hypothetical protein
LHLEEAACRGYLAQRGWELNESLIFREVIRDTPPERPEMARMQVAMEQGAFDVLIVVSRHRLCDPPVWLDLLFVEADEHGIRLTAIPEDPERLVPASTLRALGDILRGVPPSV